MSATTKEREISKEQLASLPSKKRGSLPLLVGKIFVWQILAILFVEFALFAAGLGEEEIFKLDPQVGFKHMANKRITWRSEGLATSYFDQFGLREPNVTLAKPAGTYRIVLLGDSLTESLQVPWEQSFSYGLEKGLQERLNKPIQVLNFGTSGYATVQEYLQLKNDVLKFSPDLVLVCYNTRDCFENWSPPDEVLTNVRPAALHLPGAKLVVDSSPVALWMRSPRARMLKNFDFFRHHSRLWGLLAAAELDLSMHNDTYKKVLFFLTKPGKALRQTGNEINVWVKANFNKSATQVIASTNSVSASKPAESSALEAPQSGNSKDPRIAVATATAKSTSLPAKKATIESTKSAEVRTGSPSTGIAGVSAASNSNSELKVSDGGASTYRALVERTLGSLLSEMKNEGEKTGARFAVVALPVRSALSIRQGMEDKFCNMSYADELTMLKQVSQPNNIPVINLQEPAKQLSDQEKDFLFYLVHLTPRGHKFVASQLTPAVERIVAGKETP